MNSVVAGTARSLTLLSRLISVPKFLNRRANLSTSSTMASVIKSSDRVVGFDTNLWVEYAALANETKAINLGQGFPDFSPPQFIIDALNEASKEPKYHQYTRGPGHPRLVKALGAMYSKLHGRQIDPMNEITTTIGAYSALYQSIQGHINPGDEVILIEPFFDCYNPMVLMAGGKPVFVPLRPSTTADKGRGRYPVSSKDWKLDMDELRGAVTSKTKAIILNNPNNPLGKVFDRSELQELAEVCNRHNILCISDEVYEWLIYPGNEHVRIATLPGMWDRTITIGSAGKTFSCTGWKLGWGIGPANLIKNMTSMANNLNYTNPTLLQEALGVGFELELSRFGQDGSYFKELPALLLKKRDEMARVLEEVGITPIIPEGGYFMMADTSQLGFKENKDSSEPYDVQFVKWMSREKRLAAIPPSFFYSPEHRDVCDRLIRFCFCKEDSTLEAAYDCLRKWSKEK